MVDFKAGPEEAARMLAGLSKDQRDAAIEKIALKNPEMAKLLNNLIVSFDDLQYMTIKMLQDFLKNIKLKDLGMVLRLHDGKIKNFFLSNVSSGMRAEIEMVLLGPPISASLAQEAEENIMKIARALIDKGLLILNKDEETLV